MKKIFLILLLSSPFFNYSQEEPTTPKETEIWEPVPVTVTPGKDNSAPSDAIILFNGEHMDEWMHSDSSSVKWTLNKDGSMTVKNKTGNIRTKRHFGSVQLHLEWKSSTDIAGKSGQHKSNSGVFLQGKYEVQILDNNDNNTYVNGQVGAVYKQSIPLVNASAKTGEWNTYDIIYHAPEFNSNGEKTKSATITVLHNGILIQDHYVIKGTTQYIGWPKNKPHGKGPIVLQDHRDNSGVSYRNIWVREI